AVPTEKAGGGTGVTPAPVAEEAETAADAEPAADAELATVAEEAEQAQADSDATPRAKKRSAKQSSRKPQQGVDK
ncbi:MAG: hypothetical protein ACRDT6_28220, partial [Micromonosporaceae bacterium]